MAGSWVSLARPPTRRGLSRSPQSILSWTVLARRCLRNAGERTRCPPWIQLELCAQSINRKCLISWDIIQITDGVYIERKKERGAGCRRVPLVCLNAKGCFSQVNHSDLRDVLLWFVYWFGAKGRHLFLCFGLKITSRNFSSSGSGSGLAGGRRCGVIWRMDDVVTVV